jgi:EAL domain-containing protein (putative c-di-GMP-specific phosphodiesterase class I)/GGDEF domain-containing protein
VDWVVGMANDKLVGGTPLPPPAPVSRRSETFARLAREQLETNPDEAARLALKSIEFARAEDDSHASALGMLLLSHACYSAGHAPEEVLRPVRFAIDQLSDLGDARNLADARLLLATLYLDQCAFDESAIEARAATELARLIGDDHLAALCEMREVTAIIERDGDDVSLQRRKLESLATRFAELGDIANSARAIYNVVATLMDCDPRHAARLATKGLEVLGETSPVNAMHLHRARAEAAARLGWAGVADAELAEVDRRASGLTLPALDQIDLLTSRAVVARSSGRLVDATDDLYEAFERASELNSSTHLLEIHDLLSVVHEMNGDFIGALAQTRARYEVFVRRTKEMQERRSKLLSTTGRLDAEKREAELVRTNQSELERSVESARRDLALAEHQLDLERSRRALVELRASRDPAVEPMTGLPSLPAIADAVSRMLDGLARVAVVIITFDDNRVVAPMPDVRRRLLHEMSARLHAHISDVDGALAGSLGSEDLVALIPLDESAQGVDEMLRKFHAVLARPVDLFGRIANVDVQFGVALAPEYGVRANTLLSRARLASQAAREQRPYGDVVAIFDESIEERQLFRTFVHDVLGTALERGDIEVHYQPMMDAATGRPLGAEALVRWTDPERGPIPPSMWIPFAEESGQIVQLGGFVLQRACFDAVSWPSTDGVAPVVSVNVSAAQIVGGTILTQVEVALLMSGLPPSRLAIELTESTLAGHPDVVPVLESLRKRGIKVEIDDFGTGYSSFGYLTRFPVDTVKIDKSFVDHVAENGDDAAITQAIITMAHSLRLTVVAEGVETESQASILREQGCDLFQGWLFAKAMPSDALISWFAAHTARLSFATS